MEYFVYFEIFISRSWGKRYGQDAKKCFGRLPKNRKSSRDSGAYSRLKHTIPVNGIVMCMHLLAYDMDAKRIRIISGCRISGEEIAFEINYFYA